MGLLSNTSNEKKAGLLNKTSAVTPAKAPLKIAGSTAFSTPQTSFNPSLPGEEDIRSAAPAAPRETPTLPGPTIISKSSTVPSLKDKLLNKIPSGFGKDILEGVIDAPRKILFGDPQDREITRDIQQSTGKAPGFADSMVSEGLLPFAGRTDTEKIDKRVESLVKNGIDPKRAYEVAALDVQKKKSIDLRSPRLPGEQKVVDDAYDSLALTDAEKKALRFSNFTENLGLGLDVAGNTPIGGITKNLAANAARIAATRDIDVIRTVLKDTGVPDDVAEKLAVRLQNVTDPKEVSDIVTTADEWGIGSVPDAAPETAPKAGLLSRADEASKLEGEKAALDGAYEQGIDTYKRLIKYQEGGAKNALSDGLPEVSSVRGANGRRLAPNSYGAQFQREGDGILRELGFAAKEGPTSEVGGREEANKFLTSFKEIIERRKDLEQRIKEFQRTASNDRPLRIPAAAKGPEIKGPKMLEESRAPQSEARPGLLSRSSPVGEEDIVTETLPKVSRENAESARVKPSKTVDKTSRLKASLQETKTKVIEYVQNEQERVRQLVNRKDLKVVDHSDPYLRSTLYSGRVGEKIEKGKMQIKDAIDKMAEVANKSKVHVYEEGKHRKVTLADIRKEVNDYLIARHAPERNRAIGEGAAGITTKDAEARLLEIEKGPNGEKIKEIANALQEMNNQTLDLLHDSGVISDDLYDKLRTKYKNHIPLQRIMDHTEDFAGTLSGKGYDVRSTGIKTAKGSDKEVDDILTNITSNYEQAVLRSEKNIVDQATLAFVRDNKDALRDLMYETKLPMMPVGKVKHKAAYDAVFESELVDFAKSLGAKFERGGQVGRTLGTFSPGSKTIMRKFATPREVLAHESGHFFDNKYGLKNRFYNRGQSKGVAQEMLKHMERAGESANRMKSPDERFADSFEWWLTHRDLAKEQMPLFSQAMENIIRDIPDLKPLLNIKPSPRFSIEQMEETLFARQQFTNDPTILTMREDGHPVYIKIKDPNLAIALRGVGKETNLGAILQGVASFTRLYSGLATRFNPEFALPNKIRDLQETMVYLSSQEKIGGKGALKSVTKDAASLKDVLDGIRGKDTPGAKLYQEMKDLGGTTGGMGLSTRKKIELNIKDLEKLATSKTHHLANNIVEYVDGWNTIFEDSTRLSVYKQAIDSGLSKQRAAFLAKEASINFNRMGKGGPLINALYMFSNASIQGSTKMIRALKNPKVLGAVTASVAGSVATVNQWNDRIDKNWRDKVTKYDRLNGLTVMLPSEDGKARYFTIPVSWGLKPIKVMADYAYDAVNGKSQGIKDALDNTLNAVLEAYNPAGGTSLTSALTPTILDVPVEIKSNTSWSGSKIRPDFDKNAPADIQYFPSLGKTKTGQTAISISELLHDKAGVAVSPANIKYAFDQYISGAGRTVQKLFNLGATVTSKEGLPLDQYPFISRFYRQREPDELGQGTVGSANELSDNLSDQSRERFRFNNEAQKTYLELKKLPKDEALARAQQLQAENPKLMEKVKDIAEEDKLGLSYQDKQLKQLGVENGARAMFIYKQLEGRTVEDKKYYIKDLMEKKVISSQVLEQIKALMSRQK